MVTRTLEVVDREALDQRAVAHTVMIETVRVLGVIVWRRERLIRIN